MLSDLQMYREDIVRRRWERPVRARLSHGAALLAGPLANFALVSCVAWQAPTLQDVADKMLLPLNDWPLRMMRVYTNILKKPRLGGAQRPNLSRGILLSLRVICDSVHTAGFGSLPEVPSHHPAADERPDPNRVHPAHASAGQPLSLPHVSRLVGAAQ